jgi:hypothetical protein
VGERLIEVGGEQKSFDFCYYSSHETITKVMIKSATNDNHKLQTATGLVSHLKKIKM